MPMTKSNCKNCSKRFSGCHSKCEDYLEYLRVHEEELAAINAIKNTFNNLTGHRIESRTRARKAGRIK